jgi:hypothetical protein
MIDFSSKRTRYLRDSIPIRLGGLAANLARVNSFSSNPKHNEAVARLLNESRYFIEWTTTEAELEIQHELVEIQLRMSIWIATWDKIWNDPILRAQMAKESSDWSASILKFAGLSGHDASGRPL